MIKSNEERRSGSWLIAILGGALATILATYFIFFFPPGFLDRSRFETSPEIDFNGDGKADNYSLSGSTIFVKLADRPLVTNLLPSYYNTEFGVWHYGDFNGDGLTDLAHVVTTGISDPNNVHVHFSTGDGHFRPCGTFSFRKHANREKSYDSTLGYWRAFDFDGDGKTDLVHYPGIDGREHRWRSLGNGNFEIQG